MEPSGPWSGPESQESGPERVAVAATDVADLFDRMLRSMSAVPGGDPVARVIEAARDVLSFDNAMVLAETQEGLVACVAADPVSLAGLTWMATKLPQPNSTPRWAIEDSEIWCIPPSDLLAPEQSLSCVPLASHRGRAALLLTRQPDRPPFTRSDRMVAGQVGLVISCALALQRCENAEAESSRWRETADEIRSSGDTAQTHLQLLHRILELLPVGVAVEDDTGRPMLVNAEAAAVMVAADPAVKIEPHRGLGAARDGDVVMVERTVVGLAGDRTFLTWQKPVSVLGEKLLLSGSFDITERKALETRLAKRAYFDELTGLPNRALIQEHIEDVLRRKGASERFALAFLDLDNFKHINDYYNHAMGDALLVKVADRITNRLRETDMLARISGDEFVLLLDPIESEPQLRVAIDQLLEALKRPFYIEGYEVFTSASIGMSLHPDHGRSYEMLRRDADSAMYRAKRGAKGRAALFDREMEQEVTSRMELEQRLRAAIRDRKFRCAFQPKVDMRSLDVVGFEALIRWCDDRGVIQAPGDFVGLAIELGLIDEITHFVIGEAESAIELLDEAYGVGTTMSVNIAARQANNVKFMRNLAEPLRSSPHAQRFIFELTEEAFVAKSQFQTDVLPLLRDIGVKVSIDDFGTGYSSLSALAEITADEIKIDRSFITGIHQRPRSQSLLGAIESLTNALGMTVVAEGVESFEELAYLLAATRIRYAQGYYFAKPFFIEDFGHARHLEDTRIAQRSRQLPEGRGLRSSRAAGDGFGRRG
jgi:diguanylate cyclase (GGDEF)-like protein